MLIFNCINDPFVRSMSFDRSPITLETYKEAFQKIMSQQNSHLLIIEQHEDSSKWIPIAQVHIDKDGEITMSLASEFRGKHLAKPVIKAGIDFKAYDSNGKLRIIVDKSYKPEFETVDNQYSKQDMEHVEDDLRKLIEHPELYSKKALLDLCLENQRLVNKLSHQVNVMAQLQNNYFKTLPQVREIEKDNHVYGSYFQ